MRKVDVDDVLMGDDGLVVRGTPLRPDDIEALTYSTRQVIIRGKTRELSHLMHVEQGGETVKFKVRVVPAKDRAVAAATAARVVAWFQEQVEPRLRRELMATLDDEGELRFDRLVLRPEGFAHQLVRSVEPTFLPWARLRKAHVSFTTIDILLTTDDPEVGEYGFAVERSTLNSMLIPEIMVDCQARWG